MKSELPDDLEGLLRVAGRPTPRERKPDERRRTGRRVARLGFASMVISFLLSSKGLALVALAVVGAGAVFVFGPDLARTAEPPAPSPRPVERTEVAAPPRINPEIARIVAPAETAEELPSVEAPPVPPPRVARPRAPSAATAPEPPPLPEVDERAAAAVRVAREHQLLDRALTLIRSDPARALGLAEEHAATFPEGELIAEREFIAVEALSRLGRRGPARARAEGMLRRFPNSIYRERVQDLLDGP